MQLMCVEVMNAIWSQWFVEQDVRC